MAMIDTGHGARGRSRSARSRRERAELLDLQHSRLIATVIAAVEADGYTGLTAGDVIARARISRKTFYDVFLNLEDCFLAAFEHTLASATEIAQEAFSGEQDWRLGMRAAVSSVLTLMEQERGLARLCVVDALLAGPRVRARRDQLLAQVARAFDGGRALADSPYDPPPLTADALAGGIDAVLHTRLLRADPVPLTDLLGSLMSIIVLPYLGPAAAHCEFVTPAPPIGPLRSDPQQELNPLRELDMRVTYRTVRVLCALAETPAASNREIAGAAGIVDAGQMSKLLLRLERLGLVENTSPGRRNRGVNAWRLTDLGARVQRATRRQL